jgi:hypothetical protein
MTCETLSCLSLSFFLLQKIPEASELDIPDIHYFDDDFRKLHWFYEKNNLLLITLRCDLKVENLEKKWPQDVKLEQFLQLFSGEDLTKLAALGLTTLYQMCEEIRSNSSFVASSNESKKKSSEFEDTDKEIQTIVDVIKSDEDSETVLEEPEEEGLSEEEILKIAEEENDIGELEN